MKIKELMIGDWVIPHIFNLKPSKIVGIHYNSYKGKDHVDWIDCEVRDELSIDNIKPIPITEEFLKANFEKKTHYGIFDDYYDFEIREYSESIYIVNYHCCEISTPDTQVVGIAYVHELQHFFTMMGIEKELKV